MYDRQVVDRTGDAVVIDGRLANLDVRHTIVRDNDRSPTGGSPEDISLLGLAFAVTRVLFMICSDQRFNDFGLVLCEGLGATLSRPQHLPSPEHLRQTGVWLSGAYSAAVVAIGRHWSAYP